MVQFLSINFFLDFFNFCRVFQKLPFLCVTLYNEDQSLNDTKGNHQCFLENY